MFWKLTYFPIFVTNTYMEPWTLSYMWNGILLFFFVFAVWDRFKLHITKSETKILSVIFQGKKNRILNVHYNTSFSRRMDFILLFADLGEIRKYMRFSSFFSQKWPGFYFLFFIFFKHLFCVFVKDKFIYEEKGSFYSHRCKIKSQ